MFFSLLICQGTAQTEGDGVGGYMPLSVAHPSLVQDICFLLGQIWMNSIVTINVKLGRHVDINGRNEKFSWIHGQRWTDSCPSLLEAAILGISQYSYYDKLQRVNLPKRAPIGSRFRREMGDVNCQAFLFLPPQAGGAWLQSVIIIVRILRNLDKNESHRPYSLIKLKLGQHLVALES